MTLSEIIKFTYWWSVGIDQTQITKQLKVSPNTAVDWAMFCWEVCISTIERRTGKNRRRREESKLTKRKWVNANTIAAIASKGSGYLSGSRKTHENVSWRLLRIERKKPF